MKKVLVAGATGYLGRFVVQEFKRQGYWIRALARNPKKLEETGPFLAPAVKDQIDDVFVGEVTQPETLEGLCEDIQIIFSSVGLTRQKDNLTFQDVDYQGNKNILERVLQTSVERFIYVSVYNAQLMEHLAIIKAHEDFVRELQASDLQYSVIRPTGYFSDLGEFFQMAKSGRAYLIGNGEQRLNPIHGADLAKVCVDAVARNDTEIAAGGPIIYSQREIAELAFSILGKSPKITRIPIGLAKGGIGLMRLFDKHTADLFDFFVTAGQYENVAPQFGIYALKDYYQELSSSILALDKNNDLA